MSTFINFAGVPAYLKARAQWMFWRLVRKGDKMDKPPVHPITFRDVNRANPENWVTFAEIQSIFETTTKPVNGINFCFGTTGGIVGVDFDNCRDPTTKVIDPAVMVQVEKLNSYTEISASGTGLHVFCLGSLPRDYLSKRKFGNSKIEMMYHKTSLIVTGNHFDGTPDDLQERSAELLMLFELAVGPERSNGNGHANGAASPRSQDEREQILADLREALPFIAADDYDQWIRVGMGIHSVDAEEVGFELWDGWSATSGKYISGEPARKWRSFRARSNGVTVATIFGWAIEGGWRKTNFYYEAPPPPQAEVKRKPMEFTLTETGNAERLAQMHGDILRWCQPWKKWVIYDGKRWKVDAINQAIALAKDIVRSLYKRAGDIEDKDKREQMVKFALQSESAHARKAMLELVKGEQPVPLLPEHLDRFPWLLNCTNGTLDLQNGQLRPHNSQEYITKVLPLDYDPAARCPEWEAFLLSIMGGNEEMVDFLWKAIGYSLTGDVREDCLFLLYGTGSNGKSTFLTVLRKLIGEYGKQAAFSTFLRQERETVRNDLADLAYVRLVVAAEAEEGKQFSMALIKSLTGRDMIKARFLFAEYFEYPPEMKVWLAVNHKPIIKDTTDGAWRRIRLVPFQQSYTDEKKTKDVELPDKLTRELPGILAWAVRGCLAWQRERLPIPEAVKKATADYRKESDVIGGFLDTHCILHPDLQAPSTDLYLRYTAWAEGGKETAVSQTKLASLLKERGFRNEKSTITSKMVWLGIGLQPQD